MIIAEIRTEYTDSIYPVFDYLGFYNIQELFEFKKEQAKIKNMFNYIICEDITEVVFVENITLNDNLEKVLNDAVIRSIDGYHKNRG